MRSSLFDAARYDREVLRPLRGTHGRLPAGDLLARYAIDPGMNAVELAAHLTEIRAWWRSRAQAPDFRAQVCRLLLDADVELAASAGPAMEDPAWWLEQGNRSPAGPVVAAPPAVAERGDRPVPSRDWRVDARRVFWSTLATLERAPAVVLAEQPAPSSAPAPGAEPPSLVPDLAVRPVAAEGDRCRIELSWPDAGSDVRVRHAPQSPPFGAGAEVDWPGGWGAEVTGPAQRRGGDRVLTLTVPTGYRVYLPFLVDGERAHAGRLTGLDPAPQVRELRVERDGDGAFATWVWPPEADLAEVSWAGRRHRVTVAEYAEAAGFAIAEARAGGVVAVRALLPVGSGLAYSPAVTATIDRAPVRVRYDLTRRRRLTGGAELIVTVTTDGDCSGVDLDLVLHKGDYLPLDAGQGDLLARFTGLDLHVEEPLRLTWPWPDVPRRDRPYWIVGFFHAPQRIAVEAPPIDHLRYS
ncbi:hypothetical protein OWR29_24520 [Actinoplanes sp. Pm04-4]|uniref:Uncharacterized protein n=1 Tax=Paractinoplanes pyxinae TaxID=2997416 RepID=A0ABT4B3V1_9ACTN|nr:hypothetical protein [Actinoplanes pyxinae]MCY1141176.1 hypothetical protein [Actinoplanes pyxinae]